ncbi:hypothetical protein EGT07_02300 [Herbaspirillum sp. HC18]|nr:hypothetical protein EGT07_02300 [Herbaspirillum sp. HC18]
MRIRERYEPDFKIMKSLMTLACLLACNIAAATPQALPVWTDSLSGAEFVALPKGCYQMGSSRFIAPPPDSNWERIGFKGNLAANELPQHEVCVDQFWIGKREVSEGEWHKVMGGDAPAHDGRRAKVNVTWAQAREFAEKLTASSGGKYRFRLPTEAEWEYACRAGSKNNDVFERTDLAGKAWYAQSPKRSYEPRETGVLEPNAFGLHDMLGNAWEWTADSYQADGYKRHALYNPKVDAEGAQRVLRGGSYRTELYQVRCSKRGHYDPDYTMDSIGLRLVRE